MESTSFSYESDGNPRALKEGMSRDYRKLVKKLTSLRTATEFLEMNSEIEHNGSCSEKIFICTEGDNTYALKVTLNQNPYVKFLKHEYKFTRWLNHPNIRSAAHRPQIGLLYAALPLHFVEGTELFQLLDQETDARLVPTKENAVLWRKAMNRRYIARSILAGLNFCHAAGIVHNDVKPDNVLVGAQTLLDVKLDETEVKLCDFGFAFGRDVPPAYRGSDGYLCPAKVDCREPLTSATDVFSFAMLFFALCCGLMPIAPDGAQKPRLEAISFVPIENLFRRFADPYKGLLFYREPRELFIAAAQLDAKERSTARQLLEMPFFRNEELTEGSPYVSRRIVLRRLGSREEVQ
jgi:serine/threonine protein kinase